MDQSQNHQQQQQQQLQQQQQVQMMSSPLLQQQQQQQQQQHDPSAQDVLAEARKNLQVLIDAGLSKDLLHQWVDGSQSLPIALAAQPSLAQQSNLLQQPTLAQQQNIIPPQPTIAPPPPPQCAPPPIPTMTTPSNNTSTASTPSRTDIKPEILPEDVSSTWASSAAMPMRLLSNAANEENQAIFLPPQAPFSHRPRISVSSTSSGSSGRASIWSTNSAQSSVSWQSTSTVNRSQAPLPLPPTPPTGPLGPPVGTTGKTNIYWCTSCETSFKRKYDWKRHEDEFHERWRKYPCPEPGCNRSFWGSNSFNQHHKQCHGCKTCPHAEKVVKFLRKRKYWACGFCSALHPARERHVEHVARHFESGMTKGDWMHSRVVYGLLHQPLIHEAWDALVISKQSEYNGRRPQFSWHPSKTGRAQGFLENENPGQLQDLLEFFSGDEGEAQWIVSVAYDLADIVLTSAPIPSPQYSHASLAPQAFPHDPRMSFMTLPTQAQHQSMMPSPDPQQNPFTTPFRNTILVPSQQFQPPPRPSPDSAQHSPLTASHSPLTANHSPLMPSHSPLDKRELPPPPQQSQDTPDGMMDFEYSPAPVVFDDWESLTSAVMEQPTQHQQTTQAPPDWGMVQFYGDPRVTS
ncbi:Fc.00g035190.m01.CDS01 [Cosmosporella sp. VM-42]